MAEVQAAAPFTPVPTADIEANMGPQFGPTATPNPYVYGNTPDWAQGAFAMPWWGLDPFGQPLAQEQMMYQQPDTPAAPAAPAPQVQLPQPDPADQYRQWQIQQQTRHFSRPGGPDDRREPDTSYGAYMLRRR